MVFFQNLMDDEGKGLILGISCWDCTVMRTYIHTERIGCRGYLDCFGGLWAYFLHVTFACSVWRVSEVFISLTPSDLPFWLVYITKITSRPVSVTSSLSYNAHSTIFDQEVQVTVTAKLVFLRNTQTGRAWVTNATETNFGGGTVAGRSDGCWWERSAFSVNLKYSYK
jgi:hypothetical protein